MHSSNGVYPFLVVARVVTKPRDNPLVIAY
jgi:hypothetical protein